MNVTAEQIKKAASDGQKDAARALSILAKRSVNIDTSEARLVGSEEIEKSVSDVKQESVIVYTQTIPSTSGLSFLVLERKDALTMVDLFNQREKGTTHVLTDLDYSTLTETLNILANSYINALSKNTSETILLSVPKTTNKDMIQKLSSDLVNQKSNMVGVLFGTDLSIEDEGFSVGLYFFFLTSIEGDTVANS